MSTGKAILQCRIGHFRLDSRGFLQHAYRVRNLDAVSATLRERGAQLLYDEPRRGTAGSRVNFIHPRSAGGVLVELVEPAPYHAPTGGDGTRRTAAEQH